MKKEIKRTPITFNGVNGFEVLYQDTDIWSGDECDYCMYDGWDGWKECLATCDIVHGCDIEKSTYFQFIK